ncbi:MAG: hypothetical protein IJI98_02180 [Methanosphaera sp.]|nr:hypothetical protein [Methanosphaera sp.]
MYIILYINNYKYNLMKDYTVKARQRQGTKSIDLTLPADISKEYSISRGDIFKIDPVFENDTLKLEYTLIYQRNKKED